MTNALLSRVIALVVTLIPVLNQSGCAFATNHFRQSPVNPLPLHGEFAALDEGNGAIVLVGGSSPERRMLPGTWEWNGQWHQVLDSAASPAFLDAAIAYDQQGRRVVLYTIDRFENRLPAQCSTWAYASRRWTRLTQGPCLTTRWRSLGMTQSPDGTTIMLAEGPSLPGDTALRQMRLWSLQGSEWTLRDSIGPRRTGFSRVERDRSRNRIIAPVLYGGPDAGIWEYDGRTWVKLDPTTAPAIRQTYGLAYDAREERLVLAGGQGASRGPYYDDFWSWDGREWVKLVDSDSVPPGRGGGQFFIAADGRRWVYFGGYAQGAHRDLWVRVNARWVKVD